MRAFRARIASVALMSLVLLGASIAQDEEVRRYALPGDEVYPECIAVAPDGNRFFVGSTVDGTIFTAEIGDAEATPLVSAEEAALDTAYGLAVDAEGHLWVAGGPSGDVVVYDTGSGELVGRASTPEADATFLNDVTVGPDGHAYVTDSMRPILFRVPLVDGEVGEPEAWLELDGTPIEYRAGEDALASINLNGLLTTPDGGSLITVQMNEGALFRIDLPDGDVTPIEVPDADLTNGDGLALDGDTLYVVRIANEEIVAIELNEDRSQGEVVNRFTHEALAFPACAALAGDRLLVVNAQFDAQEAGDPSLPFEVVSFALNDVRGAGGEAQDDAAEPEGADAAGEDAAEGEAEGWFPPEQVEAGEAAYDDHCGSCHASNLAGVPGVAPSLTGAQFMNSYGGRTAGVLYNYVRNNMPYGNPNSLSGGTYSDIVAHILDFNGFPAAEGAPRLTPGSRLNQLDITEENQAGNG